MRLYTFRGKCNLAGTHIRTAREAAGLSQEQLAAKLQLAGINITQKAVSRVETGVRVVPDYELPAYAKALSVGVLTLLESD